MCLNVCVLVCVCEYVCVFNSTVVSPLARDFEFLTSLALAFGCISSSTEVSVITGYIDSLSVSVPSLVHLLKLNPKVIVFKNMAFERWLSHEGATLMRGQISVAPCHLYHSKKMTRDRIFLDT